MKAVLSIAGSDSSGGAGIQADIKTIAAHNLYAETVITALTAQNTLGVFGILDIDPSFVTRQMDAVFEDIRPDAVKIGMLSSRAIIEVVAESLCRHRAFNVVVDPVMVSTSGAKLIDDDAIETMKELLFPMADIITPNIPEAALLSGLPIDDGASRLRAAEELGRFGGYAVLIKGGHEETAADDFLFIKGEEPVWLRGNRIETKNTHGTGCTLSSAIACNLALELDMRTAVRKAKDYVTGALAHDLHLGKGRGPLNHQWEYLEGPSLPGC